MTNVTAHLHTPDDPRIFVFGSNLRGIHGAGAAKYAYEKLGAVWGVAGAIGFQPDHVFPRCYALATCDYPGIPLELDLIRVHAENFFVDARRHSGCRFFVSEVGCGFAGYKPEQIAPLFAAAPENCDLPPGWR